MGARSFDPFAVERPILRLGEYGEWTLGDITKSRQLRLMASIEAIQSMPDDADIGAVASAIAELCEASCDDADGLADTITRLADEDLIGILALRGVVEFIADHLNAVVESVGEG